MTYEDCIDFLYDRKRVFTKPGLERIEYVLKQFSDPQDRLKCVHVAGTNGKGSTASMIASCLSSAGYRTGLYISPDVRRDFEGISINGRKICKKSLSRLITDISPAVRYLDETGDTPTPFEILTACAYLYFYREKCDVCVIECGMGGELDATNVIKDNLLSVITDISCDHVRLLGGTVKEIALNKAGIIKNGRDVICSVNDSEALKVIKDVCKKKNALLTVSGTDKAVVKELALKSTVFTYGGFSDIKLKTAGLSQISNACCALDVMKKLSEKGFRSDEASIKKGFLDFKMPGRFEVFSERPAVIYDGAHNTGSASMLANSFSTYFPGKKATVAIGVMADKDHKRILEIIKPFTEKLYCVTPSNERALDKSELKNEALSLGFDAETCGVSYIEDIVANAKENDAVLVTGSLYLYKEALRFITRGLKKRSIKMNDRIITVAIDGPSGAGKSTVAKAISEHFGFGYLDTGAMYRTVALYMDRMIPCLKDEVENGAILPETTEKIISLLSGSGIGVKYDGSSRQHMFLGDEDVSGLIRTPLISMEASKVSAIPEVRVFLVNMQREIGSRNSIVMDGRDIGTHVLKNATVKIYLTATPEERANRRYKELIEKGGAVTYEEVLKDIIDRDYGDTHRAAFPLRQAEDAVLLDTTNLGLEESVAAAVAVVTEKTGVRPCLK